jgi:DNA mismatch repair protein MutL
MARVRQLPPELADKIAAGEVVERPASVVKELVENSLDAGADRIRVRLEGGGIKSIQIEDNGQGMARADAELSLKRHATSKIADQEDLFRIRTMGFRGEALPAIASVSRLEMTTRTEESTEAIRITVEGGVRTGIEQAAGPVGTRIAVRDLFYNTPARLKFVKTARTETAWIKEALIRLALANPGVGFSLLDQDRTLLDLEPVVKTEDRLSDIFGREDAARLIPIREEHPAVGVEGWIGLPDQARSTSRSIYLFVNNRFIRDKTVLNGLMAGYQGRLERGRYPLAAVYLDLEPGTLDVNVHPAKLEVRFHHAQAIRQALVKAVSKALTAQERFLWTGPAQPGGSASVRERIAPRSSFAAQPARPDPGPAPNFSGPGAPPPAYPRPLPRPEPRPPREDPLEPVDQTRFRYLGTFAGLYLVGQVENDLVVIDQHAAHERLLFERLVREPGQSQALLSPQKVVLDPVLAEILGRSLELIAEFGFQVEPFGPDGRTFVVKAVPGLLGHLDPVRLVRDLASQMALDKAEDKPEAVRSVLARVACHAAVRAGREMSRPEVEQLVEDLGELSGPLTCPHGRPLIKRFSRAEFDRWFGRA